jgi:drug/metabolite transporter (DMT)-like permease
MSSVSISFVKWMIPLAIVWGVSYPLTKLVSYYSSPMLISFVRILVGFIFFYALARGLSVGVKQFINGLLNFVGLLTFLNLGVYLSPNPGLIAVMIYTQPIFIVIIEAFLGSKVKMGEVIGVILGVLGITISAFFAFNIGLLVGLLGGLVWAGGTVYYRRFLVNEDLRKLNAFMSLSSLPVMALITPIGFYFNISLYGIALLLILALLAQVGGFYFWFNAVKDLGSIRAGAGSLLVPVFAYIFSYIFFGQIPTVLEIIGSVVTLVGVYITMVSS